MGELSDGSYTSFLSLDCCLIFTVNSANLYLISEVTLILTIRLTVQYRDKYLRQGKNHHKNKNELLLLGHNLKIALLSLTRFSLEKRKNPS